MRTLVTGATGFLGAHLVRALIADGDRILTAGPELDPDRLFGRIRAADRVIHLAGTSDPRAPASRAFADLAFTEPLLDACAALDRPLLIASAAEVYGRTVCGVARETDPLVLPPTASPFVLTKLFVERAALDRGIRVVIARLFDLAGPCAPRHRPFGRLLAAAQKNRPLRVFGTGGQERAFLFVEDAARILVRLMGTTAAHGRAVNVGGTCPISLNDLARRLQQLTPRRPPIVRTHEPDDEEESIPCRLPCLARLRSLIGSIPDRGLDRMLVSSFTPSTRCSRPAVSSPSP